MKFLAAILLLFLNLTLYSGGQDISIEKFRQHMDTLASDVYEGRGTGTKGGNMAADYIAVQMLNMDIIPLGNDGSYFQYVPMHGSKPIPESSLRLHFMGEETELSLGSDYMMYKTGEQTFIPRPKELVFAGYGIFAPEYDYNDYSTLDVEGKIVVLLPGEPISNDRKFFDGELTTIYSYPESKLRIALSRGASGIVIIHDNRLFGIGWEKLKQEYAFEEITLAYSVVGRFSVFVKSQTAEKLFEGLDIGLDKIIENHFTHKIESFPLKTEMSFIGKFRDRDFVARNVAGLIQGADKKLRDSYLILTAHYDHLGIGPAIRGDSIYNGALDNAAGCAALLELARYFSANRPERSLVFLFVTGEEKGLLGATYYTDHPLLPLYKTIANVNIDGVALFDKFNSVVGIGKEYSSLEENLKRVAEKSGLNITEIPPEFDMSESFNRSDQIAFAKAGIPSILVLDGPDYENYSYDEAIGSLIYYNSAIYHTPFDDMSQDMNFDAAAQHIGLLKEFILDIANSKKSPVWYDGVPYVNAMLRNKAEKR